MRAELNDDVLLKGPMLKTSPLQISPRSKAILQVSNVSIPYQIIRSNRRKRNLSFEFTAAQMIVHAPAKLNYTNIELTLHKYRDWLCKRWLARPAPVAPRYWVDGEWIPYQGKKLRLQFVPQLSNRIHCKQIEDILEVYYPLAQNPEPAEIKQVIMNWLRMQAERVVKIRVQEWATRMNVLPGKIFITNPKMRWGSCSATNNLRFNWRIIMAAPKVLDYLVVHELAHIPHKNHGPAFWQCVLSYLPDTSALRKQLRNWRPEL